MKSLKKVQVIRAVVFDVDGTLVDSVVLHAQAWQEAFRHFGTEVDLEEVRNQIGKGGDHLMPLFLSREKIDQEGKEIEKYRKQLFEDKYMGQVKPFPKVRELFQQLEKDGKKAVLASSAKGDELQKYKKIAGIEDLLDEETSADDADKSKPEPDIFLAALDKIKDIPPGEVVVVGDSPYDAEAAGKAGLQTIGVLSGHFSEEQLRNAGCFKVYRDVAQMLECYQEWT